MASENRITEIEEDLKSAASASDALKASLTEDATELKKLKVDCQQAKTQARAAKEELRQATSITADKLYLLQCVFGSEGFHMLTRRWRLLGEFSDRS